MEKLLKKETIAYVFLCCSLIQHVSSSYTYYVWKFLDSKMHCDAGTEHNQQHTQNDC